MTRAFAVAVVASLAGAHAPLRAQTPEPARGACPPATYDECALRLERGRLYRGMPGTELGRIGVWTAVRLAPLVQGPDSARHYAELFDRHYRTGARLTLVGAVATGVLLGLGRSNDGGEDFWRFAALAVPFLALEFYGVHREGIALRALPRALWWYNRELAR